MQSKNNEIEVLRAVAIAITCINHLPFLLQWNGIEMLKPLDHLVVFWGGVDLFFCVSGYVVSKSFVETLDRARLKYSRETDFKL